MYLSYLYVSIRYGNTETYNLNNMLAQNILESDYFKAL